ncbi:class F sortase [Streptomyces sp. NBC_01216]|uniref:class F sortase n=1 Tax=unclassified Streptomyces TaxID=2593676 RepID=UPI002E13FD1E|nr:class F sortase [Streptomyces sp. NBC_01216]
MERDRGTNTGRAPVRRVPTFKTLAWTALLGALLMANALRDPAPPQPASALAGGPAARPALPLAPPPAATRRPPAALPPSDPVRIVIPAAAIDAPLTGLELDATGTLVPPPATKPDLAGWYADGTSPGAVGTAVIAGHVDTPNGPAVFYQLGALTQGAQISVVRKDGRTARFTVDAVEVYAKDRFPDKKVYGGSDRPELRLITCGGSWSKKTGYQANTVVYATLSGVT